MNDELHDRLKEMEKDCHPCKPQLQIIKPTFQELYGNAFRSILVGLGDSSLAEFKEWLDVTERLISLDGDFRDLMKFYEPPQFVVKSNFNMEDKGFVAPKNDFHCLCGDKLEYEIHTGLYVCSCGKKYRQSGDILLEDKDILCTCGLSVEYDIGHAWYKCDCGRTWVKNGQYLHDISSEDK